MIEIFPCAPSVNVLPSTAALDRNPFIYAWRCRYVYRLCLERVHGGTRYSGPDRLYGRTPSQSVSGAQARQLGGWNYIPPSSALHTFTLYKLRT